MNKQLKEFIEEEKNDEKKYMEMYEKAPDKYKAFFKDIAKDEKSHYTILENILKDLPCEEAVENENTSNDININNLADNSEKIVD